MLLLWFNKLLFIKHHKWLHMYMYILPYILLLGSHKCEVKHIILNVTEISFVFFWLLTLPLLIFFTLTTMQKLLDSVFQDIHMSGRISSQNFLKDILSVDPTFLLLQLIIFAKIPIMRTRKQHVLWKSGWNKNV